MENYNDYLKQVGELDQDKLHSKLSVLDYYQLNEDLFKYFQGINTQFASKLIENTSLSERAILKIIEDIEIALPILQRLKYRIETYSEEDLESDIKIHVDYIRNGMQLSECKSVMEELSRIEEKVEKQRNEDNEGMKLIVMQNHEKSIREMELQESRKIKKLEIMQSENEVYFKQHGKYLHTAYDMDIYSRTY
ncbi:MAG: hypothetical protein U0V04_19495 [Spirosomataceae bacterium]